MYKPDTHGFIRVAAAVPRVKVADCRFNAEKIIDLMDEAEQAQVSILVFPELSITSYTCADLFQQKALQKSALEALEMIREASVSRYFGLLFVGMPLQIDDQLFNCAVALKGGKILAAIPKAFIPNYGEFYERRWFSPAGNATSEKIAISGQELPFGTDILLQASDFEGLVVGAEICEDLWVPVPPSSLQALAGATVIVNLSASNELIGKYDYRRQLVSNQSARCYAAYVYSSSGCGESSTDLVFSGHCLLAENGSVLQENKRFERQAVLKYADIDIERIERERIRANSFGDSKRALAANLKFRRVEFHSGARPAPEKLAREVEAHPFVPGQSEKVSERCEEIFHIQTAALTKRLESLSSRGDDLKVVIGVSGGLDSTLSLLLLCKTFDMLGIPRTRILAHTLPGFGTSERTKTNARALMKELGVEAREADIRGLCLEELRTLKHSPFGIDLDGLTLEQFCLKLKELPAGAEDLVFENVQARMRTSILMNAGFVLGTGDLSELALGWCTYNADHMSMYNSNVSIPKTLVKFLVEWVAESQFAGAVRNILKDILATEISPELLPTGNDGEISQKTEAVVGPYELNDFFLFYILRHGMAPEKIVYLARQAKFDENYSDDEIRKWLRLFLKRFFGSQYKRSCLPDGPKVGSVSLSPRGDWRMPSDAEAAAWLSWTVKESHEQLRIAAPKPEKRALILVDPLNGFGSAGHSDGDGHAAEMPVEGGEQVGPVIGLLQDKGPYSFCFAAVDSHPRDMFNFASQCPGKIPFKDKVPDCDGELAFVYPDHCQVGSWSAGFLPGVREELIDEIFLKGNRRDKDSLSACGNPNLIPRLKELGVAQVDLVGLVFRICVGLTAIDLAAAGFKVRVVVDCTRDIQMADFNWVIEKMKETGVEFTDSERVLKEKIPFYTSGLT